MDKINYYSRITKKFYKPMASQKSTKGINHFLPTMWIIESRLTLNRETEKFIGLLHRELVKTGQPIEIQSDYEKRKKFIRRCKKIFF